jgi:hypothetical protein
VTKTVLALSIVGCFFVSGAYAQPDPKCIDAVSNRGAKLIAGINKAANACEKKKETGAYPSNFICRSNFVVPHQLHAPKFVNGVEAARARFTKALVRGCATPTSVSQSAFDMPCGQLEGVGNTEDLARCVIFDAHGRTAIRLQNMTNVSTVTPTPNPCRDGLSRYSTRFTHDTLQAYRRCGKAVVAGDECDTDLLAEELAEVRAINETRIAESCQDAASIPLSGVCFGTYTDIALATQCLLDFALDEVLSLVKMTYDLPFIPE